MALQPVNHTILKERADVLKQAYARSVNYDFGADLVKAHLFHADQVQTLVNDPAAKVFSVSNGYDAEKDQEVVVLECYDDQDKSLGQYLEVSWPCPPYCMED